MVRQWQCISLPVPFCSKRNCNNSITQNYVAQQRARAFNERTHIFCVYFVSSSSSYFSSFDSSIVFSVQQKIQFSVFFFQNNMLFLCRFYLNIFCSICSVRRRSDDVATFSFSLLGIVAIVCTSLNLCVACKNKKKN